MELVEINVGGTIFVTELQSIQNVPSSRLAKAVVTRAHFDSNRGMFYFDRRPDLFVAILACHRDGELHLPNDACGSEVAAEMRYWNLSEKLVAPCCIGKVKAAIGERHVAETVQEEIGNDFARSLEILVKSSGWERRRMRAWMFLEFPVYSQLAKSWSLLMALVIAMSLITLALQFDLRLMEVNPDVKAHIVLNDVISLINTTKWRMIWTGVRDPRIEHTDTFLNMVISVDFIVRFFLCPYKLKFLRTAVSVIDVTVLITYWLKLGVTLALYVTPHTVSLQWAALMCAVLQSLRPLRILRLSNAFVGLRILILVLWKSSYELCIVITFLASGMMFFSFLIFTAEIGEEGSFYTVFDGAWWAIITMTTVGYGDMYPRNALGYLVGVLCAISGMIIVGLSIPILSSNFSLYYQHVHLTMKNIEEEMRHVDVDSSKIVPEGPHSHTEGRKTNWKFSFKETPDEN